MCKGSVGVNFFSLFGSSLLPPRINVGCPSATQPRLALDPMIVKVCFALVVFVHVAVLFVVGDDAEVESGTAAALGRCEAFDASDPGSKVCAPFITDGSMIYVPGGETVGLLVSKNLGLSQILDSFPFVSSVCQSSFGKFWCRSRLRGCQQAETRDGGFVPLPRLICREECEAHALDCADDYNTVLAKSYLGQIAIQQGEIVTAPMCAMPLEESSTSVDSQMVWFMYRHGGEMSYEGNFPLLTSRLEHDVLPGQDLYPAVRTVYVEGDANFDVPCMSLDAGTTSTEVTCPNVLVPNPNVGQGGESQCLLPCPSFMYSNREYRGVMMSLAVPGLLSIFANLYMVLTHMAADKTISKFITLEVKLASFIGLLWGIIDPLLSAVLFTDVACANECTTMNCAGQGTACFVNRNSVFLLQCIQWLFASLLIVLHAKTVRNKTHKKVQKLRKALLCVSFALPSVCLVLANVLHTNDPSAPNAAVNAIRDNFSCHPRLFNWGTEFSLIYAPFLAGGMVTLYCVFMVIEKLYHVEMMAHSFARKMSSVRLKPKGVRLLVKAMSTPASLEGTRPAEASQSQQKPQTPRCDKNLKARKRLALAGLLVSILFTVTTVGTMVILPTMSAFGEKEALWFECIKNSAVSQSKQVEFNPAMENCFADNCPAGFSSFTGYMASFERWHETEGEIFDKFGVDTPGLVNTEIRSAEDLLRLGLCVAAEDPGCDWGNFMCFQENCRLTPPEDMLRYFVESTPCPSEPDLRPPPFILGLTALSHACCSLIAFVTFGRHENYKKVWLALFRTKVDPLDLVVSKSSEDTLNSEDDVMSGREHDERRKVGPTSTKITMLQVCPNDFAISREPTAEKLVSQMPRPRADLIAAKSVSGRVQLSSF
jgi:hypothetical protein